MWPWNASTMGEVYLFHFNAPLGNLSNPRAQAQHYLGFSDDFDARIKKHLAGRGAKIVSAALKQGLVFEIYHWPACLATEKLIKRTKNTARYCPACAAFRGRRVRPLPKVEAIQLAFDLEDLPEIAPARMDWLEMRIMQEWRSQRIPSAAGIDDDLL